MVGYVIVCKLPVSGMKMAFSVKDNSFALVPVGDGGEIRDALYWNTPEDANTHLAKQLEIAPKLEEFGPFEILQMVIPH